MRWVVHLSGGGGGGGGQVGGLAPQGRTRGGAAAVAAYERRLDDRRPPRGGVPVHRGRRHRRPPLPAPFVVRHRRTHCGGVGARDAHEVVVVFFDVHVLRVVESVLVRIAPPVRPHAVVLVRPRRVARLWVVALEPFQVVRRVVVTVVVPFLVLTVRVRVRPLGVVVALVLSVRPLRIGVHVVVFQAQDVVHVHVRGVDQLHLVALIRVGLTGQIVWCVWRRRNV